MRYEDLKAESISSLIERAEANLHYITDPNKHRDFGRFLANIRINPQVASHELSARATLCGFLLAVHEGRVSDFKFTFAIS